jgi:malto-oligosyltrehalose synthase
MHNPVSTYRIQFHKDFTFADFKKVIPYLHELGVKTIYASPIFEAAPGSVHGYDGVNPNKINPEIGTEAELYELSALLKSRSMSWLQDIVPNHMAFHPNNEWFMDVLEKGRQSEYAGFFDIAWTGRLYHGKIMVPFLGAPFDDVLKNGELTLGFENERFVFKYFESTYPLRPASYEGLLKILQNNENELLKTIFLKLESVEDAVDFAGKWENVKEDISALFKNHEEFLKEILHEINSDKARLLQLLDEQFYQLRFWQETDSRINFRRFFTVNSLICLNIHRPEVFKKYHELVKKLVDDGIFQGLRIDHIDGLYDPANYLKQLRELVGDNVYIVVEKILHSGEELPQNWPIQGNTGYDFLAMVNNLFTFKNSDNRFDNFYCELTGETKSIAEQINEKKSYILHQHMSGELQNLYELFMRSELIRESDYAHMRTEDIHTAIAEFLIACPVYRFYGATMPLPEDEAAELKKVFKKIKERRQDLTPAVNLLEDVFFKKTAEGNEVYNTRALRFYQRCMQFTGPLAAKGVEDTLMYTNARFIGHNDVGDSPENFGLTADEFHALMLERQAQWPMSLNATSTHDTKRGEDVRARLNVLTEMPEEWFSRVNTWREMNAVFKKGGMPDANDEYFLYQTLIGAFTMPGCEDNFEERVTAYIEKGLREAKTHSNWTTPNAEYEEAAKNFAQSLLKTDTEFFKDFTEFHKTIADFGVINSLSQLILRFTCPGIPDTYQGTELWDLSLVDPDNRRTVNYKKRQKFLKDFSQKSGDQFFKNLWETRCDGAIKLWLLRELLHLRSENAELFLKGEYFPIQVEGAFKNHVFAFARRFENAWCVVAIPLFLAKLCEGKCEEIFTIEWKDTRIVLPDGAPEGWADVLKKRDVVFKKEIMVGEIFKKLPFRILKG